jgi:hypothetical protein
MVWLLFHDDQREKAAAVATMPVSRPSHILRLLLILFLLCTVFPSQGGE